MGRWAAGGSKTWGIIHFSHAWGVWTENFWKNCIGNGDWGDEDVLECSQQIAVICPPGAMAPRRSGGCGVVGDSVGQSLEIAKNRHIRDRVLWYDSG